MLITNPDGTPVTYSGVIPTGSTVAARIDFQVPGTINGVPVNDGNQSTGNPGDPADPGVLQFSVFNQGVMSSTPLSDWLLANGYSGSNSLTMPDFLPASGSGTSTIYYGVDWSTIGGAGQNFVSSYSFGDTFTINSSGGLTELPQYVFSLTPLTYTAGSGWTVTTPVPSGTTLTYSAYHDFTGVPVPEPSTMVLLSVGLMGSLGYQLRRK